MEWYNYLLAALGLVFGFLSFVGFYLNADRKNGYGMIYAAIMVAIWSGVFYWNVYG